MKLGKVLKRVGLGLGILLAVVIIVWGVWMFWDFPSYAANTKPVKIEAQTTNLRVMSYNIRCLSPLDLNEKSWFKRAELVVDTISQEAPGVIGFQEVTSWQYDYLCTTLSDYDSIIT